MTTTRTATKPRPSARPLLTITEVYAILGVSRATLYRWWEADCGPRRIQLPNGGAQRVRADHLEDFIVSLEVAA